MSDQSEAFAAGIDFVLVAYREEGVWQVEELSTEQVEDTESLASALRRYPGDGGALGMVSVDEDFFILVQVTGASTRVLLSDVTAATEWPVARSALEFLEIPVPDDEDDQEPAGDLGILSELGMSAMDMGALLDDLDLYPDEMLADIASKVGFGQQFDEAWGVPAS
jgi:putative tRNA adenosine deaminase-associated protein